MQCIYISWRHRALKIPSFPARSDDVKKNKWLKLFSISGWRTLIVGQLTYIQFSSLHEHLYSLAFPPISHGEHPEQEAGRLWWSDETRSPQEGEGFFVDAFSVAGEAWCCSEWALGAWGGGAGDSIQALRLCSGWRRPSFLCNPLFLKILILSSTRCHCTRWVGGPPVECTGREMFSLGSCLTNQFLMYSYSFFSS